MSEQSGANQGQSVVTKILDFDLQRKHKLVEIYDAILQLADELQREKSIIQELTTQFGNFRSEIPNSKEILLEEECPIIIAGETSAGKSGFINLLIGSDILPVSALACTSTIIKLHNSTKREIRVTDDKGKEKVIEFGPDDESSSIQKEVRKYVTIKGEFLNCKCVDMYFPVPMLKGNTVIVDTPGIGTTANPELNARLFEFLPRAVAFIYIIDSSRAGGLENDRLLAIFEELRSWRQRGKLIEFDVSRTVFVCNKWDAIEEEEDEVFDYITETLREHWPNFHEKQLFKLSVKEEKKLAKQEKSSENYRKLLSGIEKMVPSSLEAKVVMNARWQQTFLTAMMDRTFGRIKWSRKCQSVKKELIRLAEQKQHVLFSEMVESEKRVKRYAEDRCVELSKQVNLYLNNPETKSRLCQLPNDELFLESSSDTHIASIEERGIRIIHNRIANELELLRQNEQIELENELDSLLLKEVQLFNEQSNEIRKLILNCRSPADRFKVLFKIFVIGTIILLTSPLWIPISLTVLGMGVSKKDEIKLSYAEECQKINELYSNPLRFMNEWCNGILLKYYSEKEIYYRLDSNCITPFKQKVQDVYKNVIQNQIKADNVFIMNVKNDIRSFKETSKLYLPFGEKAKVIMGKLLTTCMEYFSNDSISNTNVRGYLHAQKWEGRFAYVRAIEMLHEQKWVKAVVKTMKKPLNTDSSFIQLTELDSLRNINHPNIVQIYGTSIGMSDERNKYFKVYMEQCTESLENLVLQNRNFVPCGKLQDWNTNESKKSKEIYTTIMSGVLAGLAHLHDEGFVHRDLKMSNILVKDQVAKLADAGLLQLNGHTCTSNSSYFPTTVAPEAFTDEYCDSAESDIYSIGIVMWELYYCRPAFTSIPNEDLASKSIQQEEYKFVFEDALDLIDRVQRGYRPTFETYQPVPELAELIHKCWRMDMSNRPTAKMVASEMKKIIKSEDQDKVDVC